MKIITTISVFLFLIHNILAGTWYEKNSPYLPQPASSFPGSNDEMILFATPGKLYISDGFKSGTSDYYYFNTMNDVTQEAYDIINSRTGSIIGPSNAVPALAFSSTIAKPRPPCIFIVGH